MEIETLRAWTMRLLLAFVLITIGFAIGRRTAPMVSASDSAAVPVDRQQARTHQVIVYAAHMTFRCPECTQIEWLARELLENEFKDELADGSLVFKTVDYMRDPAFARKYDISSSTIVVVRLENGEERDFKRLDEVWTKTRSRDEYFNYVRAAVMESLAGEGAR